MPPMCQAQSAHTNTFEHSGLTAASQLPLYALESCRCYLRSLEEYGKQEDTVDKAERLASKPLVLIMIFRVLMYYLSVSTRCKMLKINSRSSDVPAYYTSPYLARKILAVGNEFDVEITMEDECISFLDDDYVSLDTKWRSAIVLHTIGIGWGVLICIGLILSMCCEWSSNFYRMSGCGWILICTLFTGLTFLVLDSELCTDNPVLENKQIQDKYYDDCKLGSGSILLIIGIVGLLLTGVMTCVISGKDVSRKEKEKKQDEDEKDVQEPTNDPEEPEPLVEADPEPEPVKEPEPEPVKEPKPEPVEEPEPAEEEPQATEETNVEDETAKESGQDEFELNESSRITDSDTDAGIFKSAVVAD
jgi:hypothetical protein